MIALDRSDGSLGSLPGCPGALEILRRIAVRCKRTFVFLARHEAQPLLGFPQYTILDDMAGVAGMANMADTAWLGVLRKLSTRSPRQPLHQRIIEFLTLAVLADIATSFPNFR